MHSTENSTGNDLLPQRCGHSRPHSPIKSSHFDNKKFTCFLWSCPTLYWFPFMTRGQRPERTGPGPNVNKTQNLCRLPDP